MPVSFIDQEEFKTDANVFMQYVEGAMQGIFVPQNIRDIVAKWEPRILSIINDDAYRISQIDALNKATGAQPDVSS